MPFLPALLRLGATLLRHRKKVAVAGSMADAALKPRPKKRRPRKAPPREARTQPTKKARIARSRAISKTIAVTQAAQSAGKSAKPKGGAGRRLRLHNPYRRNRARFRGRYQPTVRKRRRK